VIIRSEKASQRNVARNFYDGKCMVISPRCSRAQQKILLATWRTEVDQVQMVPEKIFLD